MLNLSLFLVDLLNDALCEAYLLLVYHFMANRTEVKQVEDIDF